ncbi:hypothetical protein Tco_0824429 [Tanacetum coccineum]|uniref:CCHC-type domain-containing protein n=1 Tax=Tanacetum coccineum TaxID=301880 RepID=A0ABQ5AKP6_9ASTR
MAYSDSLFLIFDVHYDGAFNFMPLRYENGLVYQWSVRKDTELDLATVHDFLREKTQSIILYELFFKLPQCELDVGLKIIKNEKDLEAMHDYAHEYGKIHVSGDEVKSRRKTVTKDAGNMSVEELLSWAEEEAMASKGCDDDISVTSVVDKGKGLADKGKWLVDKGRMYFSDDDDTDSDIDMEQRFKGSAELEEMYKGNTDSESEYSDKSVDYLSEGEDELLSLRKRNRCMMLVGEKYVDADQLKECLTYYSFANGFFLWFYRSSKEMLIARCGMIPEKLKEIENGKQRKHIKYPSGGRNEGPNCPFRCYGCRHVIALDGCFLKKPNVGEILTAVELLGEDIDMPIGNDLTLILDQHKVCEGTTIATTSRGRVGVKRGRGGKTVGLGVRCDNHDLSRLDNQSIERDRLIEIGFVLDFVEFISFTFGDKEMISMIEAVSLKVQDRAKWLEEPHSQARIQQQPPQTVEEGTQSQANQNLRPRSARILKNRLVKVHETLYVARVEGLTSVNQLAKPWFLNKTLKGTYAGLFFPVTDVSTWEIPNEIQQVLPPDMGKKQSARPKNRDRIRSQGEGPIINKCGRCGVKGHNRTSCSVPLPKIQNMVTKKQKSTQQAKSSQRNNYRSETHHDGNHNVYEQYQMYEPQHVTNSTEYTHQYFMYQHNTELENLHINGLSQWLTLNNFLN